jgi:hypothetical protein
MMLTVFFNASSDSDVILMFRTWNRKVLRDFFLNSGFV